MKRYSKMSPWTTKLTLLAKGEKPEHGFEEVNGAGVYEKDGKRLFSGDTSFIVMHTSCWKYARRIRKHEFKFEDFELLKIEKYRSCLFENIDYLGIGVYQEQAFSVWDMMDKKNDEFFLYSPMGRSKPALRNARRIKRIVAEIFKKGKIKTASKKKKPNNKKKMDRPSPSASATTFKVGTRRKGNDGNMYVVKANKNGVQRWVIKKK